MADLLISLTIIQGKVMSNQVYQEVYTCPSLRVHPDGSHFIAQSTGNYIVVFSSEAPYKLNKHKVVTNSSSSSLAQAVFSLNTLLIATL